MSITHRKREWVEVGRPGCPGVHSLARFETLDTGLENTVERVVPCVVLSVPPDRNEREIWIELDDLKRLVALTQWADDSVRGVQPEAA